VPHDEWSSASNMRSRKPPGGRKPINTLNRSGPGATPLNTIASRGQNVSGGSIKRQKISHEFPDDAGDDMSDDRFFNRGLQGRTPASLGRQPSISATSTHSQDALSQRSDPFGHNEARDMHRVLNATKKAGRKPKSGPTLHSSPPRDGAVNDPVTVDDDDDVHILGEQHNMPRRPHYMAVQKAPRSPTLNETFVRDNGIDDSVPETHQAQSKIRDKMQSASNTSRTIQPPQLLEDSSGDELSREPTVQSSAQKARKTVTLRSPSPNDITSTFFPNNRKKPVERKNTTVRLISLRMMVGSWENVHLVYSWADKVMQFTKNGEMLHNKGTKIQLSSKHASIASYNLKDLTTVILQGSKGGVSSGRILFEFDTLNERDTFLEVVDDMNSRVTSKELNP
jgi:hypothetical protein